MFLFPNIALCCAGGYRSGYGLSLSGLIAKTDSIVLAEFVESKDQKIKFIIKKFIKGGSEIAINEELERFKIAISRSHYKFSNDHRSNDFDGHSDTRFWANENEVQKEQVSRVVWKGGMCTPAFTFLSGEIYLLFLGSPGNFYAAEIIKTDSDKWLTYVVKRTSS